MALALDTFDFDFCDVLTVYANGGVGDGNVTETVQDPGGAGGTSARVTEDLYDWQDRQVSSEQGISTTEVSLPYNLLGIYTDGSTFASNAGNDGHGDALSANLLGSSQTWNGVPYSIGGTGGAGTSNVVTATGQIIPLPAGNFSTLSFLGMAVNGSQASQTFTVTYTDGSTQTFTQGMSDWSIPQNYPGESTVATMSYRDKYNGTELNPSTEYLYGYSFGLNASKTVQSITLPNNNDVRILSMDVFGQPAIRVTPPDAYNEDVLFQGGQFSGATGLYGFQARGYSTLSGTWYQPDPKGYVDGANMYMAYSDDPASHTDPYGTDWKWEDHNFTNDNLNGNTNGLITPPVLQHYLTSENGDVSGNWDTRGYVDDPDAYVDAHVHAHLFDPGLYTNTNTTLDRVLTMRFQLDSHTGSIIPRQATITGGQNHIGLLTVILNASATIDYGGPDPNTHTLTVNIARAITKSCGW